MTSEGGSITFYGGTKINLVPGGLTHVFTKINSTFRVFRVDSGHRFVRWQIVTPNSYTPERAADTVVRLMWKEQFSYEEILQTASYVYTTWAFMYPVAPPDMSKIARDHITDLDKKVIHPVTGGSMDLMNTIISLNDSYRWSREKIADFIETLSFTPVFK